MADAYGSDIALTGTAQDLVATYGAMAGVAAYVQNKGPGVALVAFSSSGSAPSGGYVSLAPGQMIAGTAAHCWAKNLSQNAVVAVGKAD